MKILITFFFAALSCGAFGQQDGVHGYKLLMRMGNTAVFAEMPADTVDAYILDNGIIIEGRVVKHAVRCVYDPFGPNEGQIFTTQQIEFIGPDGEEIDADKVLGWFEKPAPLNDWIHLYQGPGIDTLQYGRIKLN